MEVKINLVKEVQKDSVIIIFNEKEIKLNKESLQSILKKLIEARNFCHSNFEVTDFDINNIKILNNFFEEFKLFDEDFIKSLKL